MNIERGLSASERFCDGGCIRIYKYLSSSSRSISAVFKHRNVYFSSPENFNDPFECRPHFRMPSANEFKSYMAEQGVPSSERNKLKHKFREWYSDKPDEVREEMHRTTRTFGLFCATPHNDNLLMWSHYGEEHKGICLGFDVNLREGLDGKLIDHFFGAIAPVTYTDQYPVINVLKHHKFEQAFLKGDVREMAEFVSSLMLSKSHHWSYENEIRCIVGPMQGGVGVRSFHPERLREVILGAKVEDDFRKKVVDLVHQYPSDIDLYESRLSESKYELTYERVL